jgi:two-component system response regulator FixJ
LFHHENNMESRPRGRTPMSATAPAVISYDVYVACDDPTNRASLCHLIASAGFRTISFASTTDFLHMASSLRPGIIVAGLPPNVDASKLLGEIRSLQHQFPTVLLTTSSDVKLAVRAIKAGAIDYLHDPNPEEIVGAVRAAQHRLAEVEQQEIARDAAARVSQLSQREFEVLERLVAGMPNKAIARELEISPRTVEFHRSHIMAKMGAANLAELVRLGVVAGIRMQRGPAPEG